MQSFYQDPEPDSVEAIIAFVDAQLASLTPEMRDGATAYLSGWLTVVFTQWPDRTPEWTRPARNASTTVAIAQSYALLGRLEDALEQGQRAGMSQDELARLSQLTPGLETQILQRPVDLDRLWGAAFASGDGRYVRPIIAVLNEDFGWQHALDIVNLASRQPATIDRIYRGKPQAEIIQLQLGATAFWELISNARRYPFVYEELQHAANMHLTENGKMLIGAAVQISANRGVR